MILRIVIAGLVMLASNIVSAQNKKTEILLLGSDHLSQVYKKDYPSTDALTAKSQHDLETFSAMIARYQPDMIMVEELPSRQRSLDSLYTSYSQNRIDINKQADSRSEIYQLAFKIGKQVKLDKIYAVNAPGGTSQGILDNGTNIELYQNASIALRKLVSDKYTALQNGTLSLKEYLVFLNQPETYNQIYHLRYVTPSRIVNGKFTKPDAMVDTAFIDTTYIGAELTSIFKNRDYKIYSNIVTTEMAHPSKRILLIIGVAHIRSLKNIFRDDPEYTVVDANKYLK